MGWSGWTKATTSSISAGIPATRCTASSGTGLASGYKFFGKHDWYTELAARVLQTQNDDGSWDGSDGNLAETAFRLLFLCADDIRSS